MQYRKLTQISHHSGGLFVRRRGSIRPMGGGPSDGGGGPSDRRYPGHLTTCLRLGFGLQSGRCQQKGKIFSHGTASILHSVPQRSCLGHSCVRRGHANVPNGLAHAVARCLVTPKQQVSLRNAHFRMMVPLRTN